MSMKVSSEALLYYLSCGLFFALPLGTSPPNVLGVLAALVWLFSGTVVQKRRVYLGKSWFWPVLVLILLPWFGLLYSNDPAGLGIKFAKKTHYWVYGLALASLSFETFPPHRLIQAFILGLALNAGVAILQFAGLLPMINKISYGLGLGYSSLAAYLVLGILMASYYFRETEEKRTRILLGLLMTGYFFHLVILLGRVGFFTFLVLSPVIVRNFFKTFSFYKISLVCLLLIVAMSFSPVVRDRVALSISQIRHHLSADPESAWGREYTDYQDRFYMWYGAVRIFLDNPLLGVGTGGYTAALKARGKPDWPSIAHPHSNILYMAANFGLVGILAFLWFFAELIRNSWEARHTPQGFFVLATALVILVGGLVDTQIVDAATAFLVSVATGLQGGFSKFAQPVDSGSG